MGRSVYSRLSAMNSKGMENGKVILRFCKLDSRTRKTVLLHLKSEHQSSVKSTLTKQLLVAIAVDIPLDLVAAANEFVELSSHRLSILADSQN